jgi:hypothetical protein
MSIGGFGAIAETAALQSDVVVGVEGLLELDDEIQPVRVVHIRVQGEQTMLGLQRIALATVPADSGGEKQVSLVNKYLTLGAALLVGLLGLLATFSPASPGSSKPQPLSASSSSLGRSSGGVAAASSASVPSTSVPSARPISVARSTSSPPLTGAALVSPPGSAGSARFSSVAPVSMSNSPTPPAGAGRSATGGSSVAAGPNNSTNLGSSAAGGASESAGSSTAANAKSASSNRLGNGSANGTGNGSSGSNASSSPARTAKSSAARRGTPGAQPLRVNGARIGGEVQSSWNTLSQRSTGSGQPLQPAIRDWMNTLAESRSSIAVGEIQSATVHGVTITFRNQPDQLEILAIRPE